MSGLLEGHWECSCHCTSRQGGGGEGWGDRKMLLWEAQGVMDEALLWLPAILSFSSTSHHMLLAK